MGRTSANALRISKLGRELAAFRGHGGWVRSAAFSSDGTSVVTASVDETARVWEVSTIPNQNILQVAWRCFACTRTPFTLDGGADYPLKFDRPICATDPPPLDLTAGPAAKAAQ